VRSFGDDFTGQQIQRALIAAFQSVVNYDQVNDNAYINDHASRTAPFEDTAQCRMRPASTSKK
jgi:hypothetical protein